MSLEKAIEGLAAELKRFNDWQEAQVVSHDADLPPGASGQEDATATAAADKAKADAAKKAADAKAKADAAKKAADAKKSEPKALTKKDVQDAVVKLVTKLGRDAAAAILGPYSAAKVSDLKEEDYIAVHTAVEAALEAAKAAE